MNSSSSTLEYSPGGGRVVIISSTCKRWQLVYFYKINFIVITYFTVISIIIDGVLIFLYWFIIRRNFAAISLLLLFSYAFSYVSAPIWWIKAVSVPFFESIPASARALRPGLPLAPICLNEEKRRLFDQIGLFVFRGWNTAIQRKLHTIIPDQLAFVVWQEASIRARDMAFLFFHWFARA